ncbi:MAG: hypothetical protein WAX77_00015 [Methylococcaceae bacterium]
MTLKQNYPALILITLMALTRVHHFGDSFSLPDASLAVFFLAGLLVSNRYFLALLLVAAGLLDYVAINAFNVSDWCISPAYIFLIPTYAVLWFAGRYCTRFNNLDMSAFSLSTAIAAVATTAAFIISNGSFYLFSGRYADLSVLVYSQRVTQYYLPYLSGAMLYAVLGLAVIKAIALFNQVNTDSSNKIA